MAETPAKEHDKTQAESHQCREESHRCCEECHRCREEKRYPGANKLHHLKLPGFDRVFRSETHRWQKIIWLSGVLLCCYFCISQVVQHSIYFLSEPVAVRIYYETNKELEVPAITICPLIFMQNPGFVHLVESYNVSKEFFLDLLDRPEFDVVKVWNMSQVVSENINFTAHEGSSIIKGSYIDAGMFNASDVYTTSGKCIRVIATRNLTYRGVNTFIRIMGNTFSADNSVAHLEALQMYFHDKEYGHIANYLTGSRGYIVPITDAFSFSLGFTVITYVNRTNNRCLSSIDYASCLENYLQDYLDKSTNFSCRLPYMHDRQGVPVCSVSTHARGIFRATDEVIQDLESKSQCTRPCQDIIYRNELISQTPTPSNTSIDVSIYFTNKERQVVREYKIYSSNSLLSDIGGIIGLFMGVCLLSLIEVIEMSLFKVQKFFLRKKD